MMDQAMRIEAALTAELRRCDGGSCPPGLRDALWHAVFPAGSRVRPRLGLAVAEACGDRASPLADAAAAAVEFMHCASLVHDDLPCFDNSGLRRGRPSVHAAFGERLAVLAGDALIVMAFDCVIRAGASSDPARMVGVLRAVAEASGAPRGIAAGQAWECEPACDLGSYHRLKTGGLFAAATIAGAAAAGADPEPWRTLGDKLGEAYQVADDLRDLLGSEAELGKPIGRDQALSRPNAAGTHGVQGALGRVRGLVGEAIAAIPPCEGAEMLRVLVMEQARRVVPASLRLEAA